MEKRKFVPDDRISPGLYMDYWDGIIKKYGHDERFLTGSNYLKQFREVRNGAILAALWTKATGNKHYVSFPSAEPADIEIFSVQTVDFKDRQGLNLQRVPVQLTRCSVTDGETILEQIKKKNKPGLKGTSLVVHVSGEGQDIPIKEIMEGLERFEAVYPQEVAIIAPVASESGDDQTYLQVLLYPKEADGKVRLSTIKRSDTEAFFSHPPILHTKKGVTTDLTESGQINLQLP